MESIQQSYHPAFTQTAKRPSVISLFFSWTRNQEANRYGWLAAILAVHGCVLSPITVLLIAAGGNSIVLWGIALGAMAMCLISNLAAMPTKITLPIFFFSILLDLAVIGISVSNILTN